MTVKNNLPLESPKHYPSHTHTKSWHRMVANFCIFFLIITLTMVYFSYTGKPQAGLLEIGVSSFIFCILFHLVMKFFPLISKIITSLLVIGFAVSLVCINYHFLKVEKKDASLEELLVGDLLVHKITQTFKKKPVSIAMKDKVSEQAPVPEGKAPLTIPSMEQLTMTISSPVSSRFQSEYITLLSPVIREGTSSSEKPSGIPGIPSAAMESGHHMYEYIDKNEFLYLSLSPCIKENLLTASDIHTIQLPVISEGIGIIHELKLCNPIVENRIPVD